MFCGNCGHQVADTAFACTNCGTILKKAPPVQAAPPVQPTPAYTPAPTYTPAPPVQAAPTYTPVANKGGSRLKQYKVLTQKDKWFSGKFDPERLEAAINSYAQQGWVVKAVFSAEMPGIMSHSREEAVIILERDM